MFRYSDGKTQEKAASRCVSISRVRSAGRGAGSVWRSQSCHREVESSSKKTVCGRCGRRCGSHYDHRQQRVRDLSCGDRRVYLAVDIWRVDCPSCEGVKREGLDWLADNPFYTKRFAFYVGRRCRAGTIKDVARELHLDWHTVKELEKQYMSDQLRRVGLPGPKAIGIDEISIRKGHSYRIVVSDLIRMRPIWFGGVDRSEESMGMFYAELGERKRKGVSTCPSLPGKSPSAFPRPTQRRTFPCFPRTDRSRQTRSVSFATNHSPRCDSCALCGWIFRRSPSPSVLVGQRASVVRACTVSPVP